MDHSSLRAHSSIIKVLYKGALSSVALLFFLIAFFLPAQAHSPEETPQSETTLDYFWRKSDEAFHAGDYPRAIRLHRAIVALDPHDVESYSVAAWLLWSMEEGPLALTHIERGLNANPASSQMWDAAGQHYDLQKRAIPALALQAKEAYIRAVQLLPSDIDKNEEKMLRRRLAHAAEKADDLPLSLSTWRDLVRDFPEDTVNKNNLTRVEKLHKSDQRVAFIRYKPLLSKRIKVQIFSILGNL